MAELTCGERRVRLAAGESVLDALVRAGIDVPSACRAGVCQSCLVQVTRGAIPERAQLGLKDSLRVRGFVVACQTIPAEDLEVSVGAARALEIDARIRRVSRLAQDVLAVRLELSAELGYRAGQFLTLVRGDGIARPYSIANRPEDFRDSAVELHVRVLASGQMSRWLASGAAVGAGVRVRGPFGDCFYTRGELEQPMVLAGVGTGLAPLWGIVRDALASGHRAPIQLWHGARTSAGLYLREEIEQLARDRSNLTYHPCALEGDPRVARIGKLDELLLESMPAFDSSRFFLCGDAQLVQRLKRALFLRGASLKRIHADAFVAAASPVIDAGTIGVV